MSVKCVGRMAERWGNHPAVEIITVINEPSNDIDLDTLKSYYSRAYNAIRTHSPNVLVLFSRIFFFMTVLKTYYYLSIFTFNKRV